MVVTYKQMIEKMREACIYNIQGMPCLEHGIPPSTFCAPCRGIMDDYNQADNGEVT